MDCQNCSNKNTPKCYRQTADRVWEMAKEYNAQGIETLAMVLYEIAQQIHDLARSKELECQLKKEEDDCGNNSISE